MYPKNDIVLYKLIYKDQEICSVIDIAIILFPNLYNLW